MDRFSNKGSNILGFCKNLSLTVPRLHAQLGEFNGANEGEIACCGVLTWNSTLSDITNEGYVMMYAMSSSRLCYEVSNLRALVDARWWSVEGRAVKCENDSRYAFCPFIFDDMDPDRVDEDWDAVTSFYESHPLLFDGFFSRPLFSSGCPIVVDNARELVCRIVTTRFYRDMHHTGYLSYVADWHAYPQESMGHYCRRFQEAILPHVPQDLANPEIQALLILRYRLPPQIRQFVPAPMPGMTIGNMIDDIIEAEIVAHAMQADAFADDHQAPVDDAGLGEPQYEVGPVFTEDPIPTVPLPEIPAQEAGVDMDAEDQDAADIIAATEDQPEDPPVIDISSGDEKEFEEDIDDQEQEGWLEDANDFEDDPEEILFDDED
ncbi:hypothetical protein TIFTF001_032887 [Ficus carica]|uniref:Uncharacterized protein n=1 Tax=Ficus carica TaxID=3494 RepID=A0AA88DX77_FICCA|nr:hypothetical protein TIFTF001_032887 [Ficus carica]